MYINRALILAVGVILIFFPTIEAWIVNSESHWYRPFQLWLLVIVAIYWNQRSRNTDEL
jgi:hypothetical protein